MAFSSASANPTLSTIANVHFGRLSAKDIEDISVRRIHVTPTFDSFQNPVPGGLYDPALGFVLDKTCTTCRIREPHCTGHCGHIELPIECYHTTFMDIAYRLLKSQCAYCYRLRMNPLTINGYICKLQLLQYGLVDEYKILGSMHLGNDESFRAEETDSYMTKLEQSEDTDDFMERRSAYVKKHVRRAKRRTAENGSGLRDNPAASVERKLLLRAFFREVASVKKCSFCLAKSPAYRKEKSLKIFRKPIDGKLRAEIVQSNLHATNPLVYLKELEKQNKKQPQDVPMTNGVSEHENPSDGEGVLDNTVEEQMAMNNAEMTDSLANGSNLVDSQQYLTAPEIQAAMTLLFDKHQELFDLVFSSKPKSKREPHVRPEFFFVKRILVPPNRYRPPAIQGDDILEHAQNTVLSRIIKSCDLVKQISREISGDQIMRKERPRGMAQWHNAVIQLQENVNSLVDQEPNATIGRVHENGIKQRLEKKEGIFRKNMMGKRVNFAARTVISPDPNIETNEIGVPLVFAKKLTYPEPVTNHNFFELKQAVINGPHKYPGATAIENEYGQVLNLSRKKEEERIALANQLLTPSNHWLKGAQNKKVYRHLVSGDVVLMNRQPTLHKPSIMGHRAKVLMHEKTLRMHYANCNTYNADFDGDEMNMHFPQNEIARSEALQIADTDHQYLAATAGKPLRGLIQDHISMGVQFTSRDTMFDREEYHQLLYSCLRPEEIHTVSDKIELVPPAIVKPRPLWTGKQIITTILRNLQPPDRTGLCFSGKSSTPASHWGDNSEEGEVIFQDGDHLCGILDKSQLGPSTAGLIHSVHEVYGHTVASKLIGVLGRLLTKFLHMRAWSCGVDDLRLTIKGDNDRRNILSATRRIGRETASKYVLLDNESEDEKEQKLQLELKIRLEEVLRDDEKQNGLDMVYKERNEKLSSELTKECLPDGLAKPFPWNQMQAMTSSGAKGSGVNANQISCNLGQQVLEGRRVPVMVSGKTLPSFRPFDVDPKAGGYVSGRFLTGVDPKEYFFHAMGGREGLIDTAVKTSKSGYLQRCIVKGLEGLKTEYDYSVREATTGAVVQFLYGEDGLDTTKRTYLESYSFLSQNYLSIMAQLNIQEDLESVYSEEAPRWRKESMKKVQKTGSLDAMDPVMSRYIPGTNLSSTSESFTNGVTNYVKNNPDGLIKDKKHKINGKVSKKTFQGIMDLKYLKSLVDPGEAVGIVAAQSVGEPSTQMTLNTFHLAGHSAKNVTLGIPRLREIVMTASANLSTPVMTLTPIDEISNDEAERFAKAITKLSLAEAIDSIILNETIGKGADNHPARLYNVDIQFFPPEEYTAEYAITIKDIAKCLEAVFIHKVDKMLKKELRKKAKESTPGAATAAVPEIGRSVGRVEEQPANVRNGGDDDMDDDSDEDLDAAKQNRRRQGEDYDEPDGDEEAALAASSDENAESDNEPSATGQRKHSSKKRRSSAPSQDANQSDASTSAAGSAEEKRVEGLLSEIEHLTHYRFSTKRGRRCTFTFTYPIRTSKILLLPLLERAARETLVQSVRNISSATFSIDRPINPKTGERTEQRLITTAGVNLLAMRDYQDVIVPHTLRTNDIHAMAAHYGIEAARATIIAEVDAVFRGHGISVDNRHINLIADAMTQTGSYKAFSRNGLVSDLGSPLGRMSFETVMGVLKEAVVEGGEDALRGPSGRIVVGRVGEVGTGGFGVLVPVGGMVGS